MRWGRGDEATFSADFMAEGGAYLEMQGVSAEVVDPEGVQVAVLVPEFVSTGSYTATWVVPGDAAIGLWRVRWEGESIENNFLLGGQELFEVVEAGYAGLPDAVTMLRPLTGDRLLPSMTEDDLFFTDAELHTLWVKNEFDMDLAAYEAWVIKAAVWAEEVDHVEGGAERRASQKFRNAMMMAKHFGDLSATRNMARLKGKRVVGKSVNLRKDVMDPLGLLGAPFHGDAMYVRTYPLKRFPATLS